jgi:glycosyltransferase involved in cell wall biosynthesis
MRVLQLIDSLEAGGAERLAVNLANSLVDRIDLCAVATTRAEGVLKSSLRPEINYCFLQKTKSVDKGALLRLKNFVAEHKITIIHAHSSSYFFGFLFKLYYPKIKLIWHNHNGESRQIGFLKTTVLRLCATKFDALINVNEDLNDWVRGKLGFKKPVYLRNFAILPEVSSRNVQISGLKGFRIVCLANLRYQKNHMMLLKAFCEIEKSHPEASLHLIGRDDNDEYSNALKQFIAEHRLKGKVFIYGSRNDVADLLAHMDLGVMSSQIEGLPVSLLEYGMSFLPVVVTDVGACAEVVGDCGKVVESGNDQQLADAVLDYLKNLKSMKADAECFHSRVKELYGEQQYIHQLLPIYMLLISNNG